MKLLKYHWAFLSLFFLIVFQHAYAQTALEEAEEMLSLVNGIRADRGIAPLRLNSELNNAAFDHSYDMASNNYFSHTGLNGSTFSQRSIEAGYTGSPRGENIAAGNYSVVNTFNQWVNSPGHLNNMLNSNANEMGIGHATFNGSTYTHYWTQIFGKGSIALDVEDHVLALQIMVYPNPVTSILSIKSHIPLIKVEIYSIIGQKVKEIHSGFKSISTNDLSRGVYTLRIHSENGFTSKVIIKN